MSSRAWNPPPSLTTDPATFAEIQVGDVVWDARVGREAVVRQKVFRPRSIVLHLSSHLEPLTGGKTTSATRIVKE